MVAQQDPKVLEKVEITCLEALIREPHTEWSIQEISTAPSRFSSSAPVCAEINRFPHPDLWIPA